MERIKNLASLTPYITGFFLLLGILKQLFYYSLFDIPIRYFLEVSEVLMLFTEDILYVSALILTILIFGATSSLVKPKSENIKQSAEPQSENIKQSDAKANFKFAMVMTSFLVAMFILMIIVSSSRYERYWGYLGIAISVLVGATMVIHEIFFKRSESLYAPKLGIGITLFLLFILYTGRRLFDEAKSIEQGKYYGTIIVTKDSTYVVDSVNLFVGRTNNYSFMWNKITNTSTIIPNSEVSRMTLVAKIEN